MRTYKVGGFLLASIALACVSPQGIANASSIQIQKVTRADGSLPADQVGLHLPKFFESEFVDLGEEYKVLWSPGSGVAADTVVVRFEYLQRRAREPQSLEVKYPFDVKERRTTTFSVSKKAYRQGGEITAWRVRILHHGKVVAEQVWPSRAWK
jgi:hypothetical protein